ncbi:BA14K family protein [Rhizobium sp. P38BS-XIX]|uniref:BA14K family protein n=1 Tax=Rhizobium sp. P38BS-XIX TaxID=2726740 RepID=UPI001456E23C|nr:BA14K family protein [Rhizobium sp. P38BS-XIX]NLR96701.1 BA14K family protein [Rhizobium sp. P38BS-XIX]
MTILGKSLVISAMAAAVTLTSLGTASADEYWRHRNRDGWALGAAGLATGLIVGSAIASQPRYVEPGPAYAYPDYDAPPPPYYYRPAPRRVYVERDVGYYAPPPSAGLRPWSPQWMRYCYDRYRTFDGQSGTYVGFDGMRHFCTAD